MNVPADNPAKTGQEQAGAAASSRNLWLRLAAAAVLIPLTLGLAWLGGWWWLVLVSLVGIGLFIEWLTLVGAPRERGIAAGGVALVVAAACVLMDRHDSAIGILAVGAIVVAVLSMRQRIWATAGFAYAAVAVFSAMALRGETIIGFQALVFVLCVVWVTDTLGYFVGRNVGGAKLWPRVSPNKTWSGALGGFFGSLLVGAGFAFAGYIAWLPALLVSATLSVASQLGDLFESAIKRRFGVKDSGQLIPGHGGLLDRLDGFVAAILVAVLIGLSRGGFDGVSRGLMLW